MCLGEIVRRLVNVFIATMCRMSLYATAKLLFLVSIFKKCRILKKVITEENIVEEHDLR